MNTHPKVHTSKLVIRIAPELRDDFSDWCREQNLGVSEAIRALMERALNPVGLQSPQRLDSTP